MAMAEEWGVAGEYCRLIKAIEDATERIRGKRRYINIVGISAAILCDLGFSPQAAWAVGFLARAVSCAAHAIEEMDREKAWRASRETPMVPLLDLSLQGPEYYDGPEERAFPEDHL
jgi:citrate synthase